MLRSIVVTGGCALELSLSIHEAAVLGLELGAVAMIIAFWSAVSAARRISRDLAGIDLPPSIGSTASADPL